MSRCGECIHSECCSIIRIIALGDKAQKRCKHFTAASDFLSAEDAAKDAEEWRAKYSEAAIGRFSAEQSSWLARAEVIQKQHETVMMTKDIFCDLDRAFLRAYKKYEKCGEEGENVSEVMEDTTQAMNCQAKFVINELWRDVTEIKNKYHRRCKTEDNSNGL